MVKPRDHSVKLMIGIVVGTIVALAVGVTLYQINNQVGMSAKAADPCEAYTRQGGATSPGTVQSLDVDRFTIAADSGLSQVVVVCAGAKFTSQFGGRFTYADVKVGDKVSVAGFYGDATKTTILAKLVRDTSVSQAPQIKTNTKDRVKAKIPQAITTVKTTVKTKVQARITPPAAPQSTKTCVEGFDCTQCGSFIASSPINGTNWDQQNGATCYRTENNGAACCSCKDSNGQCAGYWDCVGPNSNSLSYDIRCTQSQ